MPKFVFIETDYQVDCCNPFFDKDLLLAISINCALREVFDGDQCPYFAHVEFDSTGFIAICSQEFNNDDLKKTFSAWRDACDNGEIYDSEIFVFQP